MSLLNMVTETATYVVESVQDSVRDLDCMDFADYIEYLSCSLMDLLSDEEGPSLLVDIDVVQDIFPVSTTPTSMELVEAKGEISNLHAERVQLETLLVDVKAKCAQDMNELTTLVSQLQHDRAELETKVSMAQVHNQHLEFKLIQVEHDANQRIYQCSQLINELFNIIREGDVELSRTNKDHQDTLQQLSDLTQMYQNLELHMENIVNQMHVGLVQAFEQNSALRSLVQTLAAELNDSLDGMSCWKLMQRPIRSMIQSIVCTFMDCSQSSGPFQVVSSQPVTKIKYQEEEDTLEDIFYPIQVDSIESDHLIVDISNGDISKHRDELDQLEMLPTIVTDITLNDVDKTLESHALVSQLRAERDGLETQVMDVKVLNHHLELQLAKVQKDTEVKLRQYESSIDLLHQTIQNGELKLSHAMKEKQLVLDQVVELTKLHEQAISDFENKFIVAETKQFQLSSMLYKANEEHETQLESLIAKNVVELAQADSRFTQAMALATDAHNQELDRHQRNSNAKLTELSQDLSIALEEKSVLESQLRQLSSELSKSNQVFSQDYTNGGDDGMMIKLDRIRFRLLTQTVNLAYENLSLQTKCTELEHQVEILSSMPQSPTLPSGGNLSQEIDDLFREIEIIVDGMFPECREEKKDCISLNVSETLPEYVSYSNVLNDDILSCVPTDSHVSTEIIQIEPSGCNELLIARDRDCRKSRKRSQSSCSSKHSNRKGQRNRRKSALRNRKLQRRLRRY